MKKCLTIVPKRGNKLLCRGIHENTFLPIRRSGKQKAIRTGNSNADEGAGALRLANSRCVSLFSFSSFIVLEFIVLEPGLNRVQESMSSRYQSSGIFTRRFSPLHLPNLHPKQSIQAQGYRECQSPKKSAPLSAASCMNPSICLMSDDIVLVARVRSSAIFISIVF